MRPWRVNDVLAWQAGYIGTGTANILALNHYGTLPLLGQRPRKVFASLTAAQNNKVVLRRVRNLLVHNASSSCCVR